MGRPPACLGLSGVEVGAGLGMGGAYQIRVLYWIEFGGAPTAWLVRLGGVVTLCVVNGSVNASGQGSGSRQVNSRLGRLLGVSAVWRWISIGILIFAVMVGLPQGAWAQSLPLCPTGQTTYWSNCYGSFTHPNGDHYIGDWKQGKPDGFGKYTAANGNSYQGLLREGQHYGWGVLTFADGRRFEGEWKNGRRNGQGIFYRADGSIAQSGIWVNGDLAGPKGNPEFEKFVCPEFLRDDEARRKQLEQFIREFSQYHPEIRNLDDILKFRFRLLETNNCVRTLENIGRTRAPAPLAKSKITLMKEGGVYKVPVMVNGVIPLHFMVDSGAADVSIPADVVMTLIRTGTLSDQDFVGEQIYRLADGSTVKSKTFRIRRLKVGDKVVDNVMASVANVNGSLLLGQSFLSRFKSVKFDYAQGMLVLE